MIVRAPPIAARAGKYLTFVLETERYGVEIRKVYEILGVLPITPMPQAPHYVKGVINLRDKVIPVVDTRTKLGMPARESTPKPHIVLVEVRGKFVGLLVDAVKEVINILEEQIEDPPRSGMSVDADFVRGLGKIGDHVVMLLDVDRALGDLEALGISLAPPPTPQNLSEKLLAQAEVLNGVIGDLNSLGVSVTPPPTLPACSGKWTAQIEALEWAVGGLVALMKGVSQAGLLQAPRPPPDN